MKIKKGSFILKVAYFFYALEDAEIPSNINLCKLFWRFIFMFFGIPFFCVIGSIIIGIGYIIGFPFASRPTILNGNIKFIHHKSWPEIKGCRILPIWILIFHPLTWYIIFGIISCKFIWFIVAVIALVLAFLYAIEKIEKSETYVFFKEFLKAKKQKVCPIVEIIE